MHRTYHPVLSHIPDPVEVLHNTLILLVLFVCLFICLFVLSSALFGFQETEMKVSESDPEIIVTLYRSGPYDAKTSARELQSLILVLYF